MPEVQNFGLAPGQIPLLSTTVTLSSAQIKALNATPIVLVPAPGAGKLIGVFGILSAYHFGSIAYQQSGGDQLQFEYAGGAGDLVAAIVSGLVTNPSSAFFYNPGLMTVNAAILPGDDNQTIQLLSVGNYAAGPIATATLGAGGLGYAANDTGTITTGNGDATYKVLTVGAGGAVLTFQITAPGTGYLVGNGQATATGGAQPGAGVGFTVNITAVQTGDGTLKVVTYYQIVPVP